MALVRSDEVSCRWNYIFINHDNMVEVTGLGIFNYKQFFALVDAYPEDFPGDIILRLVEEQQQVIRSFMKRAVTDCTRNELLHLVEKQDEVIKMLEKKF